MDGEIPSAERTPRRFHKLRIAFYATCGLACVLLIALWVRSYWWEDILTLPGDGSQRIGSTAGWITIRWWEKAGSAKRPTDGQLIGLSTEDREQQFAQMEARNTPGVKFMRPTYRFRLVDSGAAQFQHWVPVVAFAILAVVPWFRWRFSVRALLIAMTLIAAALGLGVWLAR